MAEKHITVSLPVQTVGDVPTSQLPLASATTPGATQPDESTITVDPATGITSTIGITAVVATAPLTVGGTAGSMTFVKGLLTAQTPAT
jgi:hypothetical protein